MSGDAVVEWLLSGDPTIRWQVMRDLLLHEGFRELRRRGATRIVLDVDAENTTSALRLYQSAGMTPRPAFTNWEKRPAPHVLR